MLQAQVLALQNAAPAVQAAPAAAQVVFADTPQTLGVNNLINYSTELGKDIYNHGCGALSDKALTNGFNMIPNKTVIFVEALQRHADSMGWTKGTKQITTFTNRDGKSINIIKIMARSMRPCSRLHVSNFVRWERLILRLAPSRTTQ